MDSNRPISSLSVYTTMCTEQKIGGKRRKAPTLWWLCVWRGAKVKSLGEGGRRNLTMNHSGETRGRDAKWKSAKNKEGTSEQL